MSAVLIGIAVLLLWTLFGRSSARPIDLPSVYVIQAKPARLGCLLSGVFLVGFLVALMLVLLLSK